MLSFMDKLRSWTYWGAFIGFLDYLGSPDVFAILPPKASAVIGAVAGLLAVLGLRNAIAKHGVTPV
jgi:hypothetical protein